MIKPVYVDKQMWEKIIFNLLSNAFKYTLKGSITVELASESNFAVLTIKDTGVGIPSEELPKMFDRFHRVQSVNGRTYEGTGIGLSLVKELVQMHHVTISVESEIGKGSAFTIKIPFGKDHLEARHIANLETEDNEISPNIYVGEIDMLVENFPAKKQNQRLESKTLRCQPFSLQMIMRICVNIFVLSFQTTSMLSRPLMVWMPCIR